MDTRKVLDVVHSGKVVIVCFGVVVVSGAVVVWGCNMVRLRSAVCHVVCVRGLVQLLLLVIPDPVRYVPLPQLEQLDIAVPV